MSAEPTSAPAPRVATSCGARSRLVASLALLALPSLAQLTDTGPFEENSNVQIVAKRTAARAVKLYAQLTNCTEVTITLRLALTNAVASEPLPLTVDSMGRTSFEVVTIRAEGRGGLWGHGGQYRWQYGRRGEAVESAYAYELPYVDGAYPVTQADKGGLTHTEGSGSEHAIDWAMPIGTVVCAAREGTVVALRRDSTVGARSPRFTSSCNFVVIRHEDGTFAEYGHLKRNGVLVWLGQKVKSRGVIGFSGTSGYSSGPHLHFSVFQNIDGQVRRSIPVQFKTKTGSVETLRTGQVY